MKTFISIADAATRFKEAGHEKSPRRIQEICQAGKIVAKKNGKLWMVDPDSLDIYLRSITPVTHLPIPKVRVVSSKSKRKRYIFTSAQDHTPIHTQWWDNLNAYANHIDAEIFVAPYTYKRKSNYSVDMFDEEIQDHLVNNEMRLPGLRFCAQLNLSPTAVRPLSDLATFTQSDHGIFPHPRVALNSVGTIFGHPTKINMTTGSSTIPNYEHKKAGIKAEFHHVIGATLVEFDEHNRPFCRQLIGDDDGNFQDLTNLVKNGKVIPDQRVEAITWGDIHLAKSDANIFDSSFYGKDSILEVLKPKYQFFHDLLDFEARNHHNMLDPHHWANMYYRGSDKVENEIEDCARFLDMTHRPWCKTVVVESNHDMALLKWLKSVDVRFDPANAAFYHKCQSTIYEALSKNEKINVFNWALRNTQYGSFDDIDFVDENGGYFICDVIECGTHGHRGINGSRGSMPGFSRMAMKMNIGHTHSAGIMDGVYVAGVSGSLDMKYNSGPSSWSHSHIVVYPNGKRSIITLQPDGAWGA